MSLDTIQPNRIDKDGTEWDFSNATNFKVPTPTSNQEACTKAYADNVGKGNTPQLTFSTIFEYTSGNRFAKNKTSNASCGSDPYGLYQITSSTSGEYSRVCSPLGNMNSTTSQFNRNSYFSTQAHIYGGTDYNIYFGISSGYITVASSGITYDDKNHFGFKVISISGTPILYATSCDGSVEIETAITISDLNYNHCYHAYKEGNNSIKFYVDGVLKATHTTNLPSSPGANLFMSGVSNVNVASSTQLSLSMFNWSQDAY